MSTNSECLYEEVEQGKWYVVLEDYDAPKNAWDWRDNATAYGPFPTEEKAEEYMRDNHANPGGSFSVPWSEGKPAPDETMKKLISEARKPQSNSGYGRGYGRW